MTFYHAVFYYPLPVLCGYISSDAISAISCVDLQLGGSVDGVCLDVYINIVLAAGAAGSPSPRPYYVEIAVI